MILGKAEVFGCITFSLIIHKVLQFSSFKQSMLDPLVEFKTFSPNQ